MSNDASIRVKCPLCDADVVAQRGPADQVLTCDFCLEEFKAPAQKPTSPAQPNASSQPTAPAGSTDDLPSEFDDPLSWGADELPDTTPQTSSERNSHSPGGDQSGVSDDQWLRVDEDLSTPEEDHPARKVVLTEDYEFSGPCPLCATRYVATDDQIGTTIRCPDCHTDFKIREPLPNARQPRRHGSSENNWGDDDDLRLSDPLDLAKIQSPLDDSLGSPLQSVRPVPNTTSWPRDEAGVDGQAAVASALLQKAEAEVEEQVAAQAELPPNPLTNGVLRCFSDPSLLMRWLLFAIGLQIELAAFNGALQRAMSDVPTDQFLGMMFGCFAGLFGIGLFLCGSVSLLAITQDTAIGLDQIESFPGANFMDWVFDAVYVLCALFVCTLVGALAGQIFLPFGSMAIYVSGLLAAIALSTGIVFPIYLLAVLETGSPINPLSKPVLRSLIVARGTWIQFSLMSVGLAIVAVLGCLLRYAESAILNFVAAAIVCGVMILIFRLLGRLAWTCQEAVAKDAQQREVAS